MDVLVIIFVFSIASVPLFQRIQPERNSLYRLTARSACPSFTRASILCFTSSRLRTKSHERLYDMNSPRSIAQSNTDINGSDFSLFLATDFHESTLNCFIFFEIGAASRRQVVRIVFVIQGSIFTAVAATS